MLQPGLNAWGLHQSPIFDSEGCSPEDRAAALQLSGLQTYFEMAAVPPICESDLRTARHGGFPYNVNLLHMDKF